MTENEKISAFMDNQELNHSFLGLLSDKENAQKWKTYHLIGDVMRGDTPTHKEWDIVDKVASALENEPAHQMTMGSSVTDNVVTEFIPSQPTVQEAKRTLPSWLGQFGQVAVGACFSLAIIVGVQQYNNDDSTMDNNVSDMQVLDTIPFSGSAEPVSLTVDDVLSSKTAASNEADVMEQRKRINAMLQDYELQLRLNMHDGSIDQTSL